MKLIAKKIKILIISPLPPPIGGIATWSNILLNHYSSVQSQFQIYHQNTSIKYRNITDKSVLNRIIGGIKDTFKIIKEFKKNISKISPDLIHITSSASFGLFKDNILLHIAKKNKISVITHFHFGRIPELVKRKNWEWYLLTRIIKRSSIVIVIDNKSFKILHNLGYKNIVNIPNPISNEIEDHARIQQSSKSKKKINKVVFVGHVVADKGIFELVKSCSSITDIKKLIIIGPYEDKIKDELMNLEKIRGEIKWLVFMGGIEKKEVLKQLSDASLLVLPSYTEGFPNVILEAMALACPVVATNVGAIPDMLDVNSNNPCGICVTPRSEEELSRAIDTLIKDPVKAKIMGSHGPKKVLANYTISNISSLYESAWFIGFKKQLND